MLNSATVKAPTGTVMLSYGIHRGTFASRDAVATQEFPTAAALVLEFASIRNQLYRQNLRIWYAYMIDDRGHETSLCEFDPIH